MRHKVLAPRRILIAILLAAAFGSASVYALGDGQEVPADVPDTWGVAAPMQGDAGEYRAFVIDKATGQPVGESMPHLRFQQEHATNELDVHGLPVLVDPLRVREAGAEFEFDESGEPHVVLGYGTGWILPTSPTGEVPYIGIGMDMTGPVQGPTRLGPLGTPLPVVEARGDYDFSFFFRMYPDDVMGSLDAFVDYLAGCGLRNGLQGVEADVHGEVRLLEPCALKLGMANLGDDWADMSSWEDSGIVFESIGKDTRFRALGLQQLAGRETLVFERVGGASLRVWMARDTPYPLQITREAGDVVHVIRLASFEAGQMPLGAGAEPRLPAPAVEVAPPQPWGIDDAGTLLEVPPSDAWQAALDDGPLADFLASHPLAFTHGLSGRRDVNATDGSIIQAWSFDVAQDGVGFHVTVTTRIAPLVPSPSVLPLPAVPQVLPPMHREPEHSFDYGGGANEVPPLDATWLPEALPTAASMLARERAYGPDYANLTWGIATTCTDMDGDESDMTLGEGMTLPADEGEERACAEWSYAISTSQEMADQSGNTLDSSRTPPVLVNNATWAMHASTWDAAGRITGAIESRNSVDFDIATAPGVTDTASEPYVAPPVFDDWSLPPFETVAGVGAIAALLGLVYLLWPLAKGGTLGLYARVTGTEVLEHPQRQRIMAVVEATPGIHLKEISRQTGLAWGQTQHHVGKLVQAGMLVAKPTPGYTCYFPKGQDRHVMGAAPVLKSDGARRLLQHIAGTTGLSMGQLARAAGLTESTAHYHLRKLEAAGLVSTTLVDGARRVTLTALGAEAGRRYGGAAPAVAAS